jgi:hypothetical protein
MAPLAWRMVGAVSLVAISGAFSGHGTAGAASKTQVFYVAQNGTDASNRCAVALRPCATVAHAIAESGDSSVINVAAGTYHEHGLVVTSADIEGAGQSTTFIDAGGLGQTLLVEPGGSLILRGVTLRDGSSPAHAGAVENSGTLALTGDRFVNNQAVDPGGAITNYGTVTSMNNDRFVDNTDQGIGGAIANFGTIGRASRDVFTDNFAENAAGAIEN